MFIINGTNVSGVDVAIDAPFRPSSIVLRSASFVLLSLADFKSVQASTVGAGYWNSSQKKKNVFDG